MLLGALNYAVLSGVSGLMCLCMRLFVFSVNLNSIVINDEPLSDFIVGSAMESLLRMSIAACASSDTEWTPMDVRRA